MAKKKIVTRAMALAAYARKKSMIVKYDGFPGFLCHHIGEVKREGKVKYYELEGCRMYFAQDAILNIVPRLKGDEIRKAIEAAQAEHRRAVRDLTKGQKDRLESEIQEILLADKLAPATGFNIG